MSRLSLYFCYLMVIVSKDGVSFVAYQLLPVIVRD